MRGRRRGEAGVERGEEEEEEVCSAVRLRQSRAVRCRTGRVAVLALAAAVAFDLLIAESCGCSARCSLVESRK